MSEGSTLWRVVAFDEDGLLIELTKPASGLQLAQELLESKAAVARVFGRGQLTHGDEVLARQQQLAAGEEVYLQFHREPCEPHELPTTAPIPQVLYRDPVLLAVDKPAGLLVHGDGHAADTLTSRVNALLVREGSPAKAQAVQRLDVETTGLVLFSLTEEFQPALDAQVAGHDMRKQYLAVVKGTLPGSQDGWLKLTGPIARDRHDARKMRVGPSGKPSLTRVRTLQQRAGLSLLLVELGSGRKHQIRVHLAHAGHPILGDTLYGGAHHPDGLMLHAWQESLTHPVTGERLALQTSWPTRLSKLFLEQDEPSAGLRRPS